MNTAAIVLFVLICGLLIGFVGEMNLKRHKEGYRNKFRWSRFTYFSIVGIFVMSIATSIIFSYDEYMNQKPPEPKVTFHSVENQDLMNNIKIDELKAIAERWLRYHGQ